MTPTLLTELERATEGSQNLTDKVLLACGWTCSWQKDWQDLSDVEKNDACWFPPGDPENWVQGWYRPSVTTSLDAALTLVPARWSISLYGADPLIKGSRPYCILGLPGTAETEGQGATLPLAVAIAALKARQLETAGDKE